MTLAINPHLLAFDLRMTWQARVLAHAKGKTAAVVLSVLSHNYDEAVLPLLQIVFPGFYGIQAPFFCSAAKISRRGKVYADLVGKGGDDIRRVVVYESETEMQDDFRNLADEVKLADADRLELFACVKKWIVCDFRLDPNTGEKEVA